jgi:carboxylate-amine ligase
VPEFIALSASSPFVDGVDTLFQSARLNAVSAFPLSGQCPPLSGWDDFLRYFRYLSECGIAASIKDLYWDVRPKPEYGTVEIRVCDTPLTFRRATALAGFAQALCRYLLRTRPAFPEPVAEVARFNKFQACRYGLEARIVDPLLRRQVSLRDRLAMLLKELEQDARALGAETWLLELADPAGVDATWLRARLAATGSLNDLVRESCGRLLGQQQG